MVFSILRGGGPQKDSASSKKRIVYIASSVTNASASFREFVQSFKQKLRAANSALVLEWIGQESLAVADDFYRRDLNNVNMCDVMIAFVNEPSIGVGMELQEAIAERKRLLCLYEESRVVSRLLMSACDALSIPIKSYRTLEEAVKIASDFITREKDESVRNIFFTR